MIQSASFWKALIRPSMIFIPFGLGIFFPQAAALNREPWNAVRFCLMGMIFISCLKLDLTDLKVKTDHWKVLALNLLMGVVPFGILHFACPGSPALAQAAFFVGITPTATAAPVVVAFLDGKVGFALTGFTITTVAISLSLIVLLPLVTGSFTFAFIGRVSSTLGVILLVPFLASRLVRRLHPAAREWPARCKTFTFLLWSFVLFILAAIASEHFRSSPDESLGQVFAIAGISLVLCAANFYLGGRLASRENARESSQILGQKNTSLTLYLALEFANPTVALGPLFYILWHNLWNAWQIYRHDLKE